jgi:uncharacterized protein DUF4124
MRHLLLILALAAWPAWAQIYKWVDESGRVQYGEKPPAGAKSTPLRPPQRSGAAQPPTQDVAGQERDFRRRQIERSQEEERQASEAQANRARCEQAKEELALVESVGAVYRREKGEKVYLDRNAEIERRRAQVSRYCR